jgi:general secretion pathway protein D
MKKTKIFAITLLGGFVLQCAAWSQTNAAGTNQTASSEPAPTNQAAKPPSNNEVAMFTMTNQPSVAQTNTQAAAPVSTNQPAVDAASIPLISFQDVPITTAIENLARQAGINYLLDPRVGYGQPDANGQIKPEPTLSIRWENITAEHALVALLDNYGLQLIKDPKTGISRIGIKDPTALPPLITRVVQLKYSSTSNMVESVQAALSDKRSHVLPDARTSQLVIVATEPEQASVDTLINQLDKPTRQVLIETRLVELSSNPSTAKGVDWTGTLQNQNVAFGNGVLSGTTTTTQGAPVTTTTPAVTAPGGAVITPATTTTTPSASSTVSSLVNSIFSAGSTGSGGLAASTSGGFLPNTGFLTANGLNAVLSFLNQDSDAQVISTPRVVTLDNESATISVTRAFPVINTSAGTQGSPGGSTISYSNLGTILMVTPRISANDHIWLKVDPQVSSFFGKDTETIAGTTFTADIFDYREITTQVLIPNANTLVMGGLVTDNMSSSYNTVPVLGSMPVIGLAFRHESKTMNKANLLIFITPTIVQDLDFHPDPTGFLQNRPKTPQPVMDPDSIWNRAKEINEPSYDWSDPGKPLPKPVMQTTNSLDTTAAEKALQEKMDELNMQEKSVSSSSNVGQTNMTASMPTAAAGANAPAAATNAPSSDTNAPVSGTNSTAVETNSPVTATNSSAAGTNTPAVGTNSPTTGTNSSTAAK